VKLNVYLLEVYMLCGLLSTKRLFYFGDNCTCSLQGGSKMKHGRKIKIN